MVLASYTQSRVTTISLQSKYDSKLKDATYDALKAYQLNSLTSDTSDYTNSKIRDIKASVNTFFNSIATNFSTAGYTKTTLQNYVPAVVYTMYDGYYIYSPFTNKLDQNKTNEITGDNGEINKKSDAEILNDREDATYKDGEKISGLKPYVYYSCRYKKDTDNDFVITYSLDNYITIKGLINGKQVNDAGYLLDNVTESSRKYFL